MGWLLSGLLLAVGLVALVTVLLRLYGRLRTNQAAVTALRLGLDEGSGRLRATGLALRDSRAARSASDTPDLNA